MAENKFSLDDILNEHPTRSGGGDPDLLEDILNSYPATKNYADSGLAEIFDSRKSTTDIDLSEINISLTADYPTIEEIRKMERETAKDGDASSESGDIPDGDIPEEELSEEDRIKKIKQIDYEIMSGDYDRKYMPDELKTSAELKAEEESRRKEKEKGKKKVKVKPVQKKYGLDLADNLKGLHSFDDDDDFERKYGSAPLFTEEAQEEIIGEEHIIPYELEPKTGTSLSEKLERAEEYAEKYKDPPHAKEQREHIRVKPEKITPKREPKRDPFEKYSSMDDLDSILDQYEKDRKPKALARSETSPLRGFTDIFNKLLAKDDSAGEGSELLEGARKIKKLPSQNGVPPIERKHISDLDIDLSDKMIQDTAQLNKQKAKAELDKLNALKERRSDKVKNFVLIGDEEENTDENVSDEDEEIDDFEKLDDAPSIAAHINGQKNKLAVRLLILIACFAVTAYIAAANDYSLPVLQSMTMINRSLEPGEFLFINSIFGILAGFAAYQTVTNGISKLLSNKADCDSLSALALITSLATSMISIAGDTNMIRGGFAYVYIPVAIGSLIFNTIGKLLIINRTQRSFSHIAGDSEHYALFIVEDEERSQNFTRGSLTDFPILAGMQKTEVIADFLKTSYSGDNTDRFCRIVSPITAGAGLAIGLIAGIIARTEHGNMGAICAGLSAFSACAAVCSCYAMMLVVNLPMERASKKYAEKRGTILGFDCIEEFADTNSMLVDAAQLFPAGSINLINIKSFPDTSIDEAIVEAASLTSQSGSILKSMFYDIIVGKTEMLNPVESYLYEDSMGLCGWINNKRVLLGNRELMQNHSIEGLPSAAKESEYTDEHRIAVYLSISGQLSAMFIIELTPAYQVAEALKELERRGISVMVRSVDSMLSVSRLSEMFDVSPSMFRLIPFRLHSDFEKTTEYCPKRPATLACSGSFASFAQLILGAGRLRGTISIGIAMQAAAILLGILLTLTMVLLRSMQELTVTNVLLYNLAFALIYALFQRFKKL